MKCKIPEGVSDLNVGRAFAIASRRVYDGRANPGGLFSLTVSYARRLHVGGEDGGKNVTFIQEGEGLYAELKRVRSECLGDDHSRRKKSNRALLTCSKLFIEDENSYWEIGEKFRRSVDDAKDYDDLLIRMRV